MEEVERWKRECVRVHVCTNFYGTMVNCGAGVCFCFLQLHYLLIRYLFLACFMSGSVAVGGEEVWLLEVDKIV